MRRPPLSFGPALLVANALILAILVATAAFALMASHASYAGQARQTAETLARVFATSVASDIKQVDNALVSTLRQIARAQEAGRASRDEIREIADEQRRLVPQIDALRLTDAGGIVLDADDGGALVSVADRDYFVEAKASPGRLVVSEPLVGRIIKKWGLVLARARYASDGRFDGVVYAYLSSDHFVQTFHDANLGPHGAVSLRTSTQRLVARYTTEGTASGSALGTNTVSAQLRAALASAPDHGAFTSRTSIDGIERANAYERVPGFPAMVIVGLGTEDFFRPWHRQALEMTTLCSLVEIVVAGLSLLVWLEHAAVKRLAAEQAALLDNELVGMVRLKDRVALWTNRALERLLGYGPSELLGRSARKICADDETYERIVQAYRELEPGRHFRTQVKMKRKDGSLVWIDLSGVQLANEESLWMLCDISAVKESEAQARQMALRDPLTGLSNRYSVHAALDALLEQATRQKTLAALCYIDLDGFKAVNDRHGHDAGDAVLREAARRIAACTRAHDVVARIGGDEFIVGLGELPDEHEASVVAGRVLHSLRLPFALPDAAEATIGASLGIALFPRHGEASTTLIARADEAMYVAKNGGRNRVAISAATADS